MAKQYTTSLIIKGDGKGGVKAVQATREEIEQLDGATQKGKKTAKEYGKAQKKAGKDVAELGAKVGSAATVVVASAAAMVAGLTSVAIANTQLVQDTVQTADVLNVSASNLMAMSAVTQQYGVDMAGLSSVMQDVTVKVSEFAALGTGEAGDFFEKLNLDAAEFAALRPDELLLRVGEELEDLNQNERIMFLDQLGSDDAVKLAGIIGQLGDMKGEALALGAALSDVDARQVAQAGKALDRVGIVGDGVKNQLSLALAPVITDLSNRFYQVAVDSEGFGSAINDGMDLAISAIGFVSDAMHGLDVVATGLRVGFAAIPLAYMTALKALDQGVVELGNSVIGLLLPIKMLLSVAADMGSDLAVAGLEGLESLKMETSKGIGEVTAIYEKEFDRLVDLLADKADGVLPSEKIKQWYDEVKRESESAARVIVDGLESQTGASKDYTSSLEEQADANQGVIYAMTAELALMQLSGLKLAEETALRRLNAKATDDQKLAVQELAGQIYAVQQAQQSAKKAQQEAEKAAKKAAEASAQEAEQFVKAWDKATERVDAVFADLWAGAFDDAESFFDRLFDSFKTLLAEMAHLALTRPIVMPIMQSIGQAVGLPVTGSTDVAGGVNTAWTNAANLLTSNSVGRNFVSAGNWLGDTTGIGVSEYGLGPVDLAGGEGGIFAGAESYSNVAYMGAGIAGGLVGGLFGTDNGQYGSTGGSIGATIGMATPLGPIGAAIGAVLGGLIGSFIGPGKKDPQATFTEGATDPIFGHWKSDLGEYGFTHHEDMGPEPLQGLQDMGDAMKVLDNTIASLRTAEQVEDIKAALDGFVSTDYATLVQDRLNIINSASGSVFSELVAQVTDPDKLATALVTALNVEQMMAAFDEQVKTDVTTELTQYAGTTRFQGAIDAMERALGAYSLILSAQETLNLQFESGAGGAVHMAGELAGMVGGVENLAALQSNYYSRYFSDSEQLLHSRDALRDVFAELNLVLPASKAGFRELVEAQDLNTQAGQRTYTALLGLAAGTDQYLVAVERQAAAWTTSLEGVYSDVLGREADTGGLAFYLDQLESGALTFEQVVAQIVASPEAAAVSLSRLIEQTGVEQLLASWLSDEDRLKAAQGELDQFNAVLGLTGDVAIDTRAEMSSYLQGLDLTTEAGRAAGTTAVDLAASLELVEDAAGGVVTAEKRLAAARTELTDSLDVEIERQQGLLDNLQQGFDQAKSIYRSALSSHLDGLVSAEASMRGAVESARAGYVSAVQSEIAAIRQQVSAQALARDEALRTAEHWRDAAATLADARLHLAVDSQGPQAATGVAQAQYAESLQGAWSGDLEAIQSLPGLATDYLSAFAGQASSGSEYRAMAAQISAQLGDAESMAGVQASREEVAADVAAASLASLDTQIGQLEQQLESLGVLNDSNQSIAEAAANYHSAQAAYQAEDFETRIDYYQDQLNALDGVADDIQDLDAARSNYEAAALSLARESYTQNILTMRSQIAAINSVNASVRSLPQAIAGYLSAGGEDLPKFATGGIASGPTSGYKVELHGDEGVVPLQRGYIPVKVNNGALIDEVRALRMEVAALRDDNRRIGGAQVKEAKKTANTLTDFSRHGLPKTRTN